MWWSRALALLLCLGFSLGACGFTPVHTGAGGLRGDIAFVEPDTRVGYLLVRRLEERMGRAAAPRHVMELAIRINEDELAIDAEGDVRRFNLIARVDYVLKDETGAIVQSGDVKSFTGYAATGTTVATLAARRDAEERLMTILADQVVTRLQAVGAPG